MPPRPSHSAARQRLRATRTVAASSTVVSDDQHPHGALGERHRLLGALEGGLTLGELVALVDDELSEVVGEIASRRLLEVGDLLVGVTISGEVGDLQIVEETELLQPGETAPDERQQVDGDLAVDGGDRAAEPVALEEVHRPAVGPLDDPGDDLLHFRAGQGARHPSVDSRLHSGDDHGLQPIEVVGQHLADDGVDIDRREDLLGDVVGEGGLDFRLGQRVADDVGHLVAVEDDRARPHRHRRGDQRDDRQRAEDDGDGAADVAPAAAPPPGGAADSVSSAGSTCAPPSVSLCISSTLRSTWVRRPHPC